MNFKEYLIEVAMNQKTFSNVLSRLGNDALVGFEFEFILPKESSLHYDDVEDNRDTIKLSQINSIDELNDYFHMLHREVAELERELYDWLNSESEIYADENWPDFLGRGNEDNEADVEQAKEKAARHFTDTHGFDEWVEAEYDTLAGLIKHKILEPAYGWADERRGKEAIYTEELEEIEPFPRSAQQVAADISSEIGSTPTVLFSYHESDKNKNDWFIEPDGSINENEGVGMELVSPPLPLETALEKLQAVFSWMKTNEIITDESTGLHINVSVPDIKKLDFLKLVLFAGEEHVLKQFNRIGNTYTEAQVERILDNVKNTGSPNKKDVSSLVNAATNSVTFKKYMAVNLSHLPKYVEFRAAGGENYHLKFAEVKRTLLRNVAVLEIASNPEEQKNEYLKKLALIFHKAEDWIDKGGKLNSAPELLENAPKEIVRFIKYDPTISRVARGLLRSKETPDNSRLIASYTKQLVTSIAETSLKYNLKPTPKEIAYLKMILKNPAITKDDLDELRTYVHIENFLDLLGIR